MHPSEQNSALPRPMSWHVAGSMSGKSLTIFFPANAGAADIARVQERIYVLMGWSRDGDATPAGH